MRRIMIKLGIRFVNKNFLVANFDRICPIIGKIIFHNFFSWVTLKYWYGVAI
jgi:hypothetical protein